MITSEEYMERMRSLRPNCYMHGELIQRDDPRLMISNKDIRMSFDLAEDPEYEDLLVTTSHLTGKPINRFTHIHQSADDLVKKSKMGRLLGRETGCCFQRCVGMDALNALSIVTYDIDAECGTEYFQRFLKYLNMSRKRTSPVTAL